MTSISQGYGQTMKTSTSHQTMPVAQNNAKSYFEMKVNQASTNQANNEIPQAEGNLTRANPVGTPGDDVILGTEGEDVLVGGEGDDVLIGNEGDDVLIGADGNDTLKGGKGDDTLTGGNGDDVLKGGKGDDLILGNEGNDTLKGGKGTDFLIGGEGDDVLRGGKGEDILSGGEGDDVLRGGKGDDILSGGEGDDVLRGGKGDDILNGDDGDDTIHVGRGENRVDGGEGHDTLVLKGRETDYTKTKDGDWLVYKGNGGETRVRNVEDITFSKPSEPKVEPFKVSDVEDGKASIDTGNYKIDLDESSSQWTVTNKHTGECTRIWGDPHVDENGDGSTDWDFKNDSTFMLEDGTKISVQTIPNEDGSQTTSSQLVITKGDQGVQVGGLTKGGADGSLTIEQVDGRKADAQTEDGQIFTQSGSDWTNADGVEITTENDDNL